MTNPPAGGVMELRSAIARHLSAFRGLNVQPEQVIIGAGTEYLYGLLILLLGFDKTYAFENPGYRKFEKILKEYGVHSVAVAVDEQGLSVDELEKPARMSPMRPCLITFQPVLPCRLRGAQSSFHGRLKKRRRPVRPEAMPIRRQECRWGDTSLRMTMTVSSV